MPGHGKGTPLTLMELYEVLDYRRLTSEPLRGTQAPMAANQGSFFLNRAAWGARAPKSKPSTLIRPVEMACHWEGPHMGIFSHDSCASKVRAVQAYHMDQKKWVDIAYSLMVCPHGYVFEGRGVGIRSAANGTNVGNYIAYAVCYLGGVDDPFTDQAKHGFHLAAGYLSMDKRPWRPHSFYYRTACPGSLVPWLAAGHPDPLASQPGGTPLGYPFKTQTTQHADWVEIDCVSWILMADGSVFGSPGSNGRPSRVQGVFGKDYWTAPTHHAGPNSASKLHIRLENGIYVNTIEDTEGFLFRPDGAGPDFKTH